jgi:hypothetical protein
LAFAFSFACKKNNTPEVASLIFDTIPTVKPLLPLLSEISGIADSKINPGYLWGEEDSGNPNQIHLIKNDGTVIKKIWLKNIINRDWEDMALVNNEIYIAETGDNALVHPDYVFYKFAEPLAATDTVATIETIRFTYPDGKHDAEAFVVDAAKKNIYIITKNDNPSKIYRLNFPFSATNVASYIGTLNYSGVVSAAISNDGKEMIVKTYTNLNYYQRTSTNLFEQIFTNTSISLKYLVEPQGEAICFAQNGSGFYTLSEKGFASFVNLNFYKRK